MKDMKKMLAIVMVFAMAFAGIVVITSESSDSDANATELPAAINNVITLRENTDLSSSTEID